MATNKLVLDNLIEDDFSLIAIHCSSEIYKVVFYINKLLGLHLKRMPKDVDYRYPEGLAFYELYHYYSQKEGFDYYVVSNKFKIKVNHLQSNGLLFEEETKKQANLVPEYKNVDCFLKIENNGETINLKKTSYRLTRSSKL